MQILNQPVPYAERCIRTSSGTAIVWPFLNAEKGAGPYELFLDTNALSNVQWFVQLPEEIRAKCVINPWPALQEQWLSNPQFRESTTDRIKAMIENLAKLGAPFRAQFAQQQEGLLRRNDEALRTQFSLIIPYIAIMKSLLTERLPAQQALLRLEAMAQHDIPRFTSAMMLTALGTLLKGSQSLKLADDLKPAFSYLDSFLAFQPGRKDETDHINVPYLRNRAGDLNLWLGLPLLRQQGYRFVGTPAVVTGDRALHRLIARVIPPILHGDPTMAFALSPEGLPMPLCQRIRPWRRRFGFEPPRQLRNGRSE
ncbi:hypothetical protein [Cupriavidus sp. UYPR2.512]|uniref:hypothetical protein n=1 Tax=Cupriavidus sp. UYPR2.512 TaxID=1080187 RepID=UPI0018DF73C8|nr:hypothetical protein [Cupriavidus sp. UYPR2.512]UIF86272.1 hypothetical protein KAF44_00785 [Cupriavidus necator]